MKPIANLSDEELGHEMRRAQTELPDAPLALQQAAMALWRVPVSVTELAHAALRLVHAVLGFDSWAAGATATRMRSLRSPVRHLLFSAEGRDVDLRITPVAEAYALAGQILGPDEGGAAELLRLDAASAAAHLATVDALGEFRLDGLAAGTYVLTLKLGGEQIVLPPLQVGGAAGAAPT